MLKIIEKWFYQPKYVVKVMRKFGNELKQVKQYVINDRLMEKGIAVNIFDRYCLFKKGEK